MPLDVDTVLESEEKTRRAIAVHEATSVCVPGAEIALPFADESNPSPTTEGIVSAVNERIGR